MRENLIKSNYLFGGEFDFGLGDVTLGRTGMSLILIKIKKKYMKKENKN